MASDLVERLRAYAGNDKRDYRHIAADRIEELEAALKPFAEAGDSYSHFQEDVDIAWHDFSIGQLRAASKALKP